MAYCVMTRGPCRGKMCDFWARVRIRKWNESRLVLSLRESISSCRDGTLEDLESAFVQHWMDFGVKDFRRLCEEEPDLCSKIKQVEEQVLHMVP